MGNGREKQSGESPQEKKDVNQLEKLKRLRETLLPDSWEDLVAEEEEETLELELTVAEENELLKKAGEVSTSEIPPSACAGTEKDDEIEILRAGGGSGAEEELELSGSVSYTHLTLPTTPYV